jgi:mono/diheme cytochrome c family protein
MKLSLKSAVTLLAATLALGFASSSLAGEPNKRRGQVYFKMVCTQCHVQTAEKTIPPNARTMAEWDTYMSTDKHDGSGSSEATVSYYTSTAYRESIKDSNKAAKKFLKLPGNQIYADVKAFMVSGARDSDTPASCN